MHEVKINHLIICSI